MTRGLATTVGVLSSGHSEMRIGYIDHPELVTVSRVCREDRTRNPWIRLSMELDRHTRLESFA